MSFHTALMFTYWYFPPSCHLSSVCLPHLLPNYPDCCHLFSSTWASLSHLPRVFKQCFPLTCLYVCVLLSFLVCLGFPGIWIFSWGFLGFKCLWCFQFGINSIVRHNFTLWFSLLRLLSKLLLYALSMGGLKVNVKPMDRNILLSWIQSQLKQTLLNNEYIQLLLASP